MVYPAKMNKIRVCLLKEKKDEVIEFLQKEGLLHIIKSGNKYFAEGMQFSWHVELSDIALKIRGIASMLGIEPQQTHIRNPEVIIKHAREMLQSLGPAEELLRNKKSIEEKIGDLKKDIAEAKEFSGVYDKEIPNSIFAFGLKGNMKKLRAFKEEVESKGICLRCSEIEKRKKEHYMVVLSKNQVDETLGKYGLSAFSFPKEGLINKQKSANESIIENAEDLREIDAKLNELKKENKEGLSTLLYELESLSERTKASENFMASKNVIILEGWLPAKNTESFLKKIKMHFASAVFAETIDSDHDIPPTLLNNQREAVPFQNLVEMTAFPKGNEIDPTKIFFFTIPLLYGMILGDVIYSIIAIAIAAMLGNKYKKSKLMQTAANLWMISSLAGIVWGFMFDEWLGVSHFFWAQEFAKFGIGFGLSAPLYLGFHRMEFLPLLMIASVLIGVIHLMCGFLIGAYMELNHNKKHSIAKIGYAIFLAALSLLLISFAGVSFISQQILLGALVLAMIMVVYGEGIVGIMEITSVVGNSISYVRIAAVGVVGVIIAELINWFFMPIPENGILLNVVLIILMLILHFINAVIAMFEGLIQGGRLNVIEFSTKFYKGGGIKYNPFGFMLKR